MIPESRFVHVAPTGAITPLASLADALAAHAGGGGYIWLDYINPSREDLLALVDPLGLHPLAIEDCLDEDQVPKMEEYPGHTFLLFNHFEMEGEALRIEEVDYFVGPSFLISVAAHARTPIRRDRLEKRLAVERAALGRGPDSLLHLCLDVIVDGTLPAIENLQDDLDRTEEQTLTRERDAVDPSDLVDLRRNLLLVRKSLFHEREVLMKICRGGSPNVSDASTYHFRDVYDHVVKFVEEIEECRDMIATLLEVQLALANNRLALVGNRTNHAVRRLTFITTVFMPLSFLAGVGGMSEWSMMTGPHNWRIAYPLFLAAMASIGAVSYWILKWLDRRGEVRDGR
ncbi:MAG: magnesium transporter CorA family protein [Acidobacteria bacterium]|nr:magnesium transporter CorA family protein [Acidobacteriota bacterium]